MASKQKPINAAPASAATEFNVEVHNAQKHVLSARQRFLTLACGRRWGKDHLAAIKIITHSFGFKSPRGPKLYGWINPVYNPQGKDSFRVFFQFAKNAGLIKNLIRTPPMEMILINDDMIRFFSADQPDNLRGGQYDGVIVNEAGMIAGLSEMWNEVIYAMLLDRLGWAWIMGTPKGKNAFHKFFMRGLTDLDEDGQPNRWKSFRFPTYTNPFISTAEIDNFRKELPEDTFQQEFLAEFLDTGGMVFRGLTQMRERSQGLTLWPQAGNCRVGIDLAKIRDWTALVALSPDSKVVGFDRFKGLDWDAALQRVLLFCTRFRGKVVIDAAPPGDLFATALQKKGIPTVPVKFTNERKSALVQNLKVQIEQAVISMPVPGTDRDPSRDTAHIWHELEGYAFEVTPSGNIRYGAPQGMHDDCVTALMLAASEPPGFGATMDSLLGDDPLLDLNNFREPGMASYGI